MHFSRILTIGLLCAMTTPAFAATTTPFTTEPFSDVPTTHLSYEAIEFLRQQNVIRGYPDGTFKPEARINRAEFLQLITNPFLLNTTRLQECVREEINNKPSETIFYKDVAYDAWYAPAVCLATVQNIINGYPDGTFRPANNVTFVEAAKILGNVFAFSLTEEPGEEWYKPYVDRLSARAAIPTTIQSLSSPITRSEMAEILYRLKENITTKQSRAAAALQP